MTVDRLAVAGILDGSACCFSNEGKEVYLSLCDGCKKLPSDV